MSNAATAGGATTNIGATRKPRPDMNQLLLAASMQIKQWIDHAHEEEVMLINQAVQSFEEVHLLTRLQRRIWKALGLGQDVRSGGSHTGSSPEAGAESKAMHASTTALLSTSSAGQAGPDESQSTQPTQITQNNHHTQPTQQAGSSSQIAPTNNPPAFTPTLDAIHAWNEYFDIDLYLKPEYDVEVPALPFVNSILTLFQRPKRAVLPPADIENIYYYLSRLYKHLRLQPDSMFTMLIYLERLQRVTPARLTERTWIPLVTAALICVSKIWDDFNIFNVECTEALPFFGLEQLSLLERRFTVGLQYSLGVTTAEYSKQYYAIRDMVTANEQRLQQLEKKLREHGERDTRRRRPGGTGPTNYASNPGTGHYVSPTLSSSTDAATTATSSATVRTGSHSLGTNRTSR